MTNKEIGEMIRVRRESRGMSQSQLAAAIGSSPSAIGMYERGDRRPKQNVAEALADVFNVPLWSIYYKESEMQPKVNTQVDRRTASQVRIPLVGSVAGGEPIYDEEIDMYVFGPGKADCAVRLKGHSMEPMYVDGDIIYVRLTPNVHDGEIAVVILDDEATLKRVYHTQNGLQLLSENPKYPPITATFDEYNTIRILGTPCGFTRWFTDKPLIRKGF